MLLYFLFVKSFVFQFVILMISIALLGKILIKFVLSIFYSFFLILFLVNSDFSSVWLRLFLSTRMLDGMLFLKGLLLIKDSDEPIADEFDYELFLLRP